MTVQTIDRLTSAVHNVLKRSGRWHSMSVIVSIRSRALHGPKFSDLARSAGLYFFVSPARQYPRPDPSIMVTKLVRSNKTSNTST